MAQAPKIFGDKALSPKLLRLRELEGEAEASMQTRTQLAAHLNSAQGLQLTTPAAFNDVGAVCLSEWVLQLLGHEAAVRDVPARMIKEACTEVFGSGNRAIELQELKSKYAVLIAGLDRLAQQRVESVRGDLEKIREEVVEVEDFIEVCFDKILNEADSGDEEDAEALEEEGFGSMTKEQFVNFLCGGEDAENRGVLLVNAKDAESLFDKMAGSEKELTFERFKDQVTSNCLAVLRSQIEVRRTISKRYRDYWF